MWERKPVSGESVSTGTTTVPSALGSSSSAPWVNDSAGTWEEIVRITDDFESVYCWYTDTTAEEGETVLGETSNIDINSATGEVTRQVFIEVPEGEHVIHAVCRDNAGYHDKEDEWVPGNLSDPSDPITITVDTTPTDPPVINGLEVTTDTTVTWSRTVPEDAVSVLYMLDGRDLD